AKLAERALLGRDVFAAPGETAPAEEGEIVRYKVSLFDLVDALREILKRTRDKAPREIALRDIPVHDCIPLVLAAFDGNARIEFAALFENSSDRSLIVATFLALLELIRRGEVRAFQERSFGPIMLERGIGRTQPAEQASDEKKDQQ